MTRFQRWNPDSFLTRMRQTVPGYERLQDETVAATGTNARRVLELGTGTGQTAQRVLAHHPGALLVGVDASSEILARARAVLPSERVDLRVGRLEDPPPRGPFDVVVSVLAVHHLDADGKARLFRRVAGVLAPGGRLVIGDFVVPTNPSDIVSDLDPEYDTPSSVEEHVQWLSAAGLRAALVWSDRDLAVIAGEHVRM